MSDTLTRLAARSNGYPLELGAREARLAGLVKDYVDALPAVAAPYRVIGAGSFTTAGGDAAESIPVTGLLSTDTVLVTLKTVGATPRTVTAAAAGAGAIAVTMSGDPDDDHVLSWVAIRANA